MMPTIPKNEMPKSSLNPDARTADVFTGAKQKRRARDLKQITNCVHKESPHYAKGMCKKCYSLNGKEARATACSHSDRMSYAKGLCHKCYCKWYNYQYRNHGRLVKRNDDKNANS